MYAIDMLKEIAEEERVHAGELLRLLKELEPDEEKFYAKVRKRWKRRKRKENETT